MARVCMLLNNFEPPYGGPELQAQKISQELIKRGHQVLFIAKGSGKAPRQETVAGISVYRLNMRGLASVEAYYQLWRLRESFDIIHVHGVGRLASVAISFAKKFNKKVYIKVTTAGHIMKPIPPGPLGVLKKLSPFRKRKVMILKKADGMIAISSEIYDELIDNGFIPENVFSIPNGVDKDKFHPVTSAEKNNLRNKLGLPLEKKILIFTGKITRRKGIDTLVSAWSQAKDMHKNAVLVLVGSGQGHSDSLEDWVDQYTAEQEIAATVIQTGAVDNVHDYLAAADGFVFPSRREGLSNSLLEAMATGLVCIASDIGGNRDLIENGKTGLLVDPENQAAWSKALPIVFTNKAAVMANSAENFINKQYSIVNTVNQIEAVYNQKAIGCSQMFSLGRNK